MKAVLNITPFKTLHLSAEAYGSLYHCLVQRGFFGNDWLSYAY